MKYLLLFSLSISLIISCSTEPEQERAEQMPKVQVKVTHITKGYLPDDIELSGKTVYLNKSTIVAPINGYITKVNIRQGDRVKKGSVLFEMQSPEAHIMQQSDSLKTNYGIIKVHAPVSGIVASLNIFQQNVYAEQGSAMTSIVEANKLKVQINLPFEYREYAKIGKKCKIILPDSTIITVSFSKILPGMNEQTQTVKILANLQSNIFIPENMLVKVLIDKSNEHEAQIIDKNCVQTDALMSKFWIMKLINDSTAVRNTIKIGNQTHTRVEIVSPVFSSDDKFIIEGAYGLEDSVLVEIIK